MSSPIKHAVKVCETDPRIIEVYAGGKWPHLNLSHAQAIELWVHLGETIASTVPRDVATEVSTSCRNCGGTGIIQGYVESVHCPTCRGTGRTKGETIASSVPRLAVRVEDLAALVTRWSDTDEHFGDDHGKAMTECADDLRALIERAGGGL